MRENIDPKLEACLNYFRARPVYEKLFQKIKEKYAGLGHIGGNIVLTGLNQEEKIQLGGFLQKDYSENKTVTVSVRLLEKCLDKSRFSGISLEEILRAYFDEELIVKKEEKRKEAEKREQFFEEILKEHQNTLSGKWLGKVLDHREAGYEICMQQYKENPGILRELLSNVLNGAEQLPAFVFRKEKTAGNPEWELLAVFSAKVTGNPHYFDVGTAAEKLLLDFVQDYLQEKPDCSLSVAEQKNRLFFRAGILKDDLSNEVLVYGIRAWKRDGCVHRGIEGFFQEREPVRMPLRTLRQVQYVTAQQKKIYVVENPSVFAVLIEKNPGCAAVCINGQPRLAALILLDLLKDSHMFYYAGDFDPEGLLIAQHLKERYGENLHFWNYDTKWYDQYVSDVKLSETRIKKLGKVHLEELQELKNCIQKEKRAAYQEAMLQVYC